ncbi:MAG: hypothetical protein ACOX0L_06905 [Natronincolaceae bacterium]|nr:hypothetical protein [Bacillota bacterium]
MYGDNVIQDILQIKRLKEKLAETCKETYYLFITGFNTGLKLQELLTLTKKDLMELKKTGAKEIVEPNFWQEIETYMEKFADRDFIFPEQNDEATRNEGKMCRVLRDTAKDMGIDNFGNETLSKTHGYFHYQKFRDIEKLRKRFGLVSPTATLHYIGYRDDKYLCFHCNIGCIWNKM